MTRERFFEVYAAHGIDAEWAEIVWNRFAAKHPERPPTEAEAEESASSWRAYADDGGF